MSFKSPSQLDHKTPTRAAWVRVAWEQVRQDLRAGTRVFRRNPAFTVAAVITLALRIGANAAVFSVFDAVVLKLCGHGPAGLGETAEVA